MVVEDLPRVQPLPQDSWEKPQQTPLTLSSEISSYGKWIDDKKFILAPLDSGADF